MFFLKGSNNGRLWATSRPGSFKNPSRKSPQLCHKYWWHLCQKRSIKRKGRSTKQGLLEWILGQIQHLKLIPSPAQLDLWPLVWWKTGNLITYFTFSQSFFPQCFPDCHPLLCRFKLKFKFKLKPGEGFFEDKQDQGLFPLQVTTSDLIFGASWCLSYWNDFCK